MRKLSEKQKGYAENVTRGLSKDRSAIMAGATTDAVPYFDASPTVQEEIARIRKEVQKNTKITREEVVEMFMEAAGFARILGDSMGLIAAAREVGKMLGYYAPEVKKTLHGIDEAGLKKALKDMNDDDLYKLANARTIEGESVRQLPAPGTGSEVLPKAPDV
jgi:ribosomal protein S25